jgi:hypothetical protein
MNNMTQLGAVLGFNPVSRVTGCGLYEGTGFPGTDIFLAESLGFWTSSITQNSI